MTGPLTNEEFFVKLAELFASRKGKDHGQIYLTQKRLTYGDEGGAKPTTENPIADLENTKPLPIFIRATNAKSGERRTERITITTTVMPEALDIFYARYAEVCKAGMMALKPRDKSKKKAKAKKRKGGAAAAPATAKS